MNPNSPDPNHPQPSPQPISDTPVATETPNPTQAEPVAPPSPEPAQASAPPSPAPVPAVQKPELPARSSPLKSLFLKILIGCLLASAVVAVVAILAGGLGDIGGKALWTIFIVGLHALLALGFISMDGTHDEAGGLKVFANVVFGIIVLSFITATLGIWEVMPGDIAWKMYICYGVLLIAVLHGEVLARMLNHQASINNTIYANFAIMALVVAMLWIWILMPELVEAMDPYFLRILAAAAVIDGTLTLTAVILDRLYLSKHPQLITQNSVVTQSHSNGPTVIVIVVAILVALQMLPALFFALF